MKSYGNDNNYINVSVIEGYNASDANSYSCIVLLEVTFAVARAADKAHMHKNNEMQ